MGPAMDHYRCFRLFIPRTGSKRITEIVQFFPQQVRMPSTLSQYAAIKAIHYLTHDIKHPTPATPTLLLGDEKTHALETLARVFNLVISQPDSSRKQDTIRQEPRVVAKNNTIIPSPLRVQLKLNHPIKNKTRTISLFQPPQTLTSVHHIVSPIKTSIPPTKPSNVTPTHIVPPNKSTLPEASSLISHKAKLSHEKAANIRKSK